MPFRDSDRKPPPPRPPVEPSPTKEEVFGVLQAAKDTDTPWWTANDVLIKLPPPASILRTVAALGGHGIQTGNAWLALAGLAGLGAAIGSKMVWEEEISAVERRASLVQAHLDRLVEEGRIEVDKTATTRTVIYRAL